MKAKVCKEIKNYAEIVVGSLITAVAISIFLVPYKIAPGGVSGLATVVYHLSGFRIPVGVTMLVLNVPLFVIGMGYIGKGFVFRTLFGTVLLSFLVDITGAYVLPRLEGVLTGDLLLTSLFGGFFMGLGLAIVFRAGATTGGSDLAARIAHKSVPSFTMGQHLLIIDTAIIIIAAVVFRSFELGMYAIVTLYISSKVIDAILEGVNFAKALFIISDKADVIAERILKELERGVTALDGTGVFTGKRKKVLLCVVHRSQIPALKELVRNEDDKAFVIMADIREVLGEGFTK